MELFDNYLLGKLNPNEIEAFDLKLNQDSEFKSEFEDYKTIVLGIKDYSRNDLKNFLKEEELPEIKMVAFWKKPLQIAASLILLVGLGFIIKLVVLPINNSTAITNAPESSKAKSENIDTNAVSTEVKFLEIESEKKELAEMEKPLAPPVANVEQMEMPKESNSAYDNFKSEDVKAVAPATTYAERDDVDFNVLSEKKLRDTTITTKLLVFNYNMDAEKDNLSEVRITKAENKKPGKSLPAPANNTNAGNVNMNDKANAKYKIDTAILKKNKEHKTTALKNYKVEFWQSPINFKGYKFIGNTIQLYGLDVKNIKLYDVNNTVYIKVINTVYKLKNCSDACVYQTETDTEILNFISKL